MKKTNSFVRPGILFPTISMLFTSTVLAAQNTPVADFMDNPLTGDDGKYLLWLGLIIIFMIAIIRIIMLSRKK